MKERLGSLKNDEVNPLGLRDDISERISDYGALGRELSDDDRDKD